MKSANRFLGTFISAIVVGALAGFFAGRANADGIPTSGALWYAGMLEDGGQPVTATKMITVELYDAPAGGDPLCSASETVQVTNGAFRIHLPDECTDEVAAGPDRFVSVSVGTTPIGERMQIGAVPYAVEANRASNATGPLAASLTPPGMIAMFASTCPAGWVFCDGTGACPDLTDAYVKGGAIAAQKAGSSTHVHDVGTFATAANSGTHSHGASVVIGRDGDHDTSLFSIGQAVPTQTSSDGSGVCSQFGRPPTGSHSRD